MSFASVPLLAMILSAIGTVCKAIWDIAAKAASRSAFYIGVIVPTILRWFLTARGFTFALTVFLGLQVAAVMRIVFRLTQAALAPSASLAFFNAHFKWAYWLMWAGPFNLRHLYQHTIPDILGVWVSIVGIKYLFRKVAWIKFLVTKNFGGGGSV